MCQSPKECLNIYARRVLKISIKGKGKMQVRNRKNNLTNSSKSPLIVTKQEGKNNTASGQKPHALCLCERCCHDSVFFCAQCHSQHQRARASKIQKPQSMELWKN